MESRRSERMRSSEHQQTVKGAVSRGCRKVGEAVVGVDIRPGNPRCFVRVPNWRSSNWLLFPPRRR